MQRIGFQSFADMLARYFVQRPCPGHIYGKGYEDRLVESVRRKPTAHTIWMLNRVINGTKVPKRKRHFLAAMEQARLNPLVDQDTLQLVNRFLERLSE